MEATEDQNQRGILTEELTSSHSGFYLQERTVKFSSSQTGDYFHMRI